MTRILAALALSAAFASGAQAQAVALVTDLTGDSNPAILSEMKAGAELDLRKGARLTVLYYASGHEFTFDGPARIRFSPKEPLVLQGPAPRRRTLTATGVTVRAGGVAPAAFVMRGTPKKASPPPGDAPFSERVAYAVWLEQNGMKGDAVGHWRALAAERPSAQRLRELAAAR